MADGLLWDLLAKAPDPGQGFGQGFDQGQQQRVWGDYVKNPNDPRTLSELMQRNPELGMKAQEFALNQRKYSEAERATQLQRRAAAGDKGALAELAGVDLDAWGKLDDASRAQLKQANDYIGQAALAVSQLPEEQRAAAWDAAVDRAAQSGINGLDQYKGHYSPDELRSALSRSGLVDKFLQTQKIEWHQQGEQPSFATYGGSGALVDPQAVMNSGTVTGGSGLAPTRQQRSLEEWAQDAIENGADPAAVAQRLGQLQGGAGQGDPQTFP